MYNRVKFHLYSISGCEVKKFEMFSWRWSIHEMANFERFRALSSPNVARFCWNLHHSYYSRRARHCLRIFENSNFYRNRTFPKFALFFSFWPTLRPFSSWRRPKSNKLNIHQDETTPSGYPKIAKSRPYVVPIFQEKYDYFLSYFGCFLVKKGAWSHFKGSINQL